MLKLEEGSIAITHNLPSPQHNHCRVKLKQKLSGGRWMVQFQRNEIQHLRSKSLFFPSEAKTFTFLPPRCFYCSGKAPKFMRGIIFEIEDDEFKWTSISSKTFKRKDKLKAMGLLMEETFQTENWSCFEALLKHVKEIYFKKDLFRKYAKIMTRYEENNKCFNYWFSLGYAKGKLIKVGSGARGIMFMRKSLREVLRCFTNALENATNDREKAISHCGMGQIQEKLSSFVKAESHYVESLKLREDDDVKEMIQMIRQKKEKKVCPKKVCKVSVESNASDLKCTVCGVISEKSFLCLGCDEVRYCGKKCARQNRKAHMKVCQRKIEKR